MTTETWLPIADFPDYGVSDQGNVRRLTSRTCAKAGTILKQCDRGNGYLSVDLCRDGKRQTVNVHRIVADAFLSPIHGKPEVNHKNGVKSDNRAENLEFMTSSENQKHAYVHGLQSAKGEKNGQAKLTEAEVLSIIDQAKAGVSVKNLAASFGVAQGTVDHILRGRRWASVTGGGIQC